MFEIRIHGRGGQGVVTAAELLAVAAFDEGRHAQAFPSFGSERTGAPVASFCRISERPIRSREPVSSPDALIVVDPTLLHQVDVFGGARRDAYVLINTARSLPELGLNGLAGRFQPERVVTVPATELARRHLGRPLPNAALLGAFAAITGIVSLDAVERAIRERFPGAVGDGNAAAARAAHAATLTVHPATLTARPAALTARPAALTGRPAVPSPGVMPAATAPRPPRALLDQPEVILHD